MKNIKISYKQLIFLFIIFGKVDTKVVKFNLNILQHIQYNCINSLIFEIYWFY